MVPFQRVNGGAAGEAESPKMGMGTAYQRSRSGLPHAGNFFAPDDRIGGCPDL